MTEAAKKKRLGCRGYVTSRPFGGYAIPVPLQSLALRDYCQRKDLLYVLPVNENIFPSSFLVLEGMIQGLVDYDGIVMCSMHMLPESPQRRRRVLDAVVRQGCKLHTVIEDITVATSADVETLEELLLLGGLARNAPQGLQLN
jgi:sporadic carbohydrate cluster protein (TIGR04323 family)